MKRLFSLLLLVWMGLFICREAVAKLDPESHAMLSNPGYAKHIEVQCYLVTREQLTEVFASENAVVVQKANKDLYQKNVFLLVRCRNLGNRVTFGTLNCLPPNCASPFSIEITRMWANQAGFYDYAFYIGGLIIFSNNELPKITCEWDCLYTM